MWPMMRPPWLRSELPLARSRPAPPRVTLQRPGQEMNSANRRRSRHFRSDVPSQHRRDKLDSCPEAQTCQFRQFEHWASARKVSTYGELLTSGHGMLA